MPADPRSSPEDTTSFEELARRASELGFKTTAEDYRLIENRLKTLQTVLDVVRGIDVEGFEPASTFAPQPGHPT